ncbi:hypothetical protein V6N13_072157 [Hibiscus sabdariffa]
MKLQNQLEGFDQMLNEVLSYFQGLIGSINALVTGCSPTVFKEILQYEFHDKVVEGLIATVTDKEIKEAIFRQDNDKAPGPDGYSTGLFKVV